MNLVVAWILVPLVLTLTCVGLGLLVDRVLRLGLAALAVPGVGLAALIVLAGTLSTFRGTARFSAEVCAGLALIGLGVALRSRRVRWRQPTRVLWLLAPAAATFAVYAAPALLSGQGLVAGYVKLDDSATWLALTDWVQAHGHDVSGLPSSSYGATVQSWLGGGYPVGGFMPLAVGSELVRTDLAMAYQPTIATLAAIAAWGLAATVHGFLRRPWAVALAAVLAMQASLLFGYATWGGIKEVAATSLLAQVGPHVAAVADGPRRPNRLAVLTVIAAAILRVFGVNGAVWAAPAVGLACGLAWLRHKGAAFVFTRVAVIRIAAALSPLAIVGLILLVVDREFIRNTGSVLSAESELGNLIRPLPLIQAFGLWPVGDFRFDPDRLWLARALAITCAGCAAVGLHQCWTRREYALPALAGTTAVGVAAAVVVGSPWVDAKALTVLAPVVLLAAATCVLAGLHSRSTAAASAATAGVVVLVVGCAWSSIAVVGSAWVAPRGSFEEMRLIGDRFSGRGPAVMLDFDAYGSRYFLRDLDAEGATDIRVHEILSRDGQRFPFLSTVDVDQVATDHLFGYPVIVRRTSPSSSRPPSAYDLVFAGRFWEVWERPADASPPLARLPLGSGTDPTGVAACDDVAALARTPGASSLIAATGAPPTVVDLAGAEHPSSWSAPSYIVPRGDGSVIVGVLIGHDATYRIWISGSVLGRVRITVDGRDAGSVTHQLGHVGYWLRFDALALAAGEHTIEIRHERAFTAGAWSTIVPPLGPLALTPEGLDQWDTIGLPISRAAELCDGQPLDWIEAVP